MILLIDNYDSFTYNLVQRLGEIDPSLDLEVHRNDQITLDEIEARRPSHLIISPGPCTPNEAGISVACVKRFAGRIPLLGVCLGHQAIGQAFGGQDRPRRAADARQDRHDPSRQPRPVRGAAQSLPGHPLPQPGDPARHAQRRVRSLRLEQRARTATREIMGIRHKQYPLFGVQFHPESFLTDCGTNILERFLAWAVASGWLSARCRRHGTIGCQLDLSSCAAAVATVGQHALATAAVAGTVAARARHWQRLSAAECCRRRSCPVGTACAGAALLC